MPATRAPAVMPALIENPALTESMLMELAATRPRQMVGMLLASPRARSSPGATEALAANPELAPEELQALKQVPTPEAEAPAGSEGESEGAHTGRHQEHGAEIATRGGNALTRAGKNKNEEPDQ